MSFIDPEITMLQKQNIHFSLYPRNAKMIINNPHNLHKCNALFKLL